MSKVVGLIKGLSSDVVAFAVIFVAVAAYGLYRGKESLVSLLISIYLGMAAYNTSAFLKSFLILKQNNTQVFFSHLIVYLVLVIIINLVISRIIGATFVMSKMRNWLDIALLSIAVVASFVVIAFNTLSLSLAYSPNLLSASLLASGTALLWTLIASFVIVFFAGR
jgi:hypothetical protein